MRFFLFFDQFKSKISPQRSSFFVRIVSNTKVEVLLFQWLLLSRLTRLNGLFAFVRAVYVSDTASLFFLF